MIPIRHCVFAFFLVVGASCIQVAYAEPTYLVLDPLPSAAYVGDTMVLSGYLSTWDDYGIMDALIEIKDDDPGPDDLIATVMTDEYGEFYTTVTVEEWDSLSFSAEIYAVFEGASNFDKSRSDTYSVTLAYPAAPQPATPEPTYLVLDPLPSAAYVGDTMVLSGYLSTWDDYGIMDALIEIKDDDPGPDDLIATVMTDEYGEFYTTVTVEEWDSLSFSAEIYAVFEGASNFDKSRSDTYSVTLAYPAAPPQTIDNQVSEDLPEWVKKLFVYYTEENITDADLIATIKYLVVTGVISDSAAALLGIYVEPADEKITSYETDDDGKIDDKGDFYVTYGPHDSFTLSISMKEWLESNRLLEYGAEWLNEHFRLPHDVRVSAQECGEKNAYYYPTEKAIVMCYELIEYMFVQWWRYNDNSDDQNESADFVRDVTTYIFYHEIAHALIDVHNLDYTGREENVADQFGTLMLTYYEDGQDMLYKVGEWYIYNHGDRYGEFPYWDTHGTDLQRFYNVACYAYGANPDYRGLVAEGYVPADRASNCAYEFYKLKTAWGNKLQDYTNNLFD